MRVQPFPLQLFNFFTGTLALHLHNVCGVNGSSKILQIARHRLERSLRGSGTNYRLRISIHALYQCHFKLQYFSWSRIPSF